jgi:hypothetical protein
VNGGVPIVPVVLLASTDEHAPILYNFEVAVGDEAIFLQAALCHKGSSIERRVVCKKASPPPWPNIHRVGLELAS